MKHIVGQIENFDVIYIAEKDTIFCKNTALKYSVIKSIVLGSKWKSRIEDKDLDIEVDTARVRLGCLKTSMSNCRSIIEQTEQIKKTLKTNKNG